MELEFSSHTIMPNEVFLLTLPDGGSNTLLLFSATGTPSSDGSNLYYTRPGTTVIMNLVMTLSILLIMVLLHQPAL